MNPIVYIVTDPDGKDLSTARKYGTFRVILTGKETTEQAIEKLDKALENFKLGDYLLPIGKSINMGLAIHFAWGHLDFNTPQETSLDLNVLIWRRQQQDYTVESIAI